MCLHIPVENLVVASNQLQGFKTCGPVCGSPWLELSGGEEVSLEHAVIKMISTSAVSVLPGKDLWFIKRFRS